MSDDDPAATLNHALALARDPELRDAEFWRQAQELFADMTAAQQADMIALARRMIAERRAVRH